MDEKEHLKVLIARSTARLEYADLERVLCAAADECYGELQEHLKRTCKKFGYHETDLLDHIWMQRNVRHGSFLRGDTYERLFLESDGVIADTLGTLPYLLLLGLISDPAEFLSFRPAIGSA